MKNIAYILLILIASAGIYYFKNNNTSDSAFKLIDGTEYNFELIDNDSTLELLIQVSVHTGVINELTDYISLKLNSKEINLNSIDIESSGSSHHKSYTIVFDKLQNKNKLEISITDNTGESHKVRITSWNT